MSAFSRFQKNKTKKQPLRLELDTFMISVTPCVVVVSTDCPIVSWTIPAFSLSSLLNAYRRQENNHQWCRVLTCLVADGGNFSADDNEFLFFLSCRRYCARRGLLTYASRAQASLNLAQPIQWGAGLLLACRLSCGLTRSFLCHPLVESSSLGGPFNASLLSILWGARVLKRGVDKSLIPRGLQAFSWFIY